MNSWSCRVKDESENQGYPHPCADDLDVHILGLESPSRFTLGRLFIAGISACWSQGMQVMPGAGRRADLRSAHVPPSHIWTIDLSDVEVRPTAATYR
jgi:hypothetical protein